MNGLFVSVFSGLFGYRDSVVSLVKLVQYFGLVWLFVGSWIQLFGEGTIIDIKVLEQLKDSVQLELEIGPREAREENSYRKGLSAEQLIVDDDSDEKQLILLAKHLGSVAKVGKIVKKVPFIKKIEILEIRGPYDLGEKRQNANGREYLSTAWTIKGAGQLRLGEVETLNRVGEKFKIKFWIHKESEVKAPVSNSEDWDKYLSVSRGDADRPFPTLAMTLEMEERRRQLLRQVESFKSERYVTAVHSLVHMSSEDALSMVQDQLSPDGTIKAALAREQLVITDRKDYVLNILQILEALDRQAPEVSIEVKIVEVQRGSGSDIGVNWSGSKDGQYGGSLLASTMGDPAPSVLGHTLPISTLAGVVAKGTDQLTMQISALLQQGMAKVMSEPKLMVANRSTGEFRMTEKIPVMVRKKVNIKSSGNEFWNNRALMSRNDMSDRQNYARVRGSGVSEDTVYEEVMMETGITLKVTPQIKQSGVIELSLNPKITEMAPVVTSTDTPVLATREINTKAYVQDGETLVLGGLIYEKTILDKGEVPLLGKIPGLGGLFRREQRRKEKRELLFLVKTQIVQL
jgi:Flp pilus assembly secretin CpaC